MTNEEAKKNLVAYMYFAMDELPKQVGEAISVACYALEKQIPKKIPKKITHEATIYKCCTCPNCKNVVDEYTEFLGKKVRVTYAYCHYCGQKLDWSDNDEK